jgi:hypothetical protein
MGTLDSWTVIDANNNAAPPDGWPENTMNYSDVNNTGRAVQGTLKRFFADINGSLDAGGVADAYTVTLNETGYTAYFDGMTFACLIPITNLTATPTMDVNGIGPVTIVDHNGNPLSAGELFGGGSHTFQHDGTNLRIVGTGGVAGLDAQFQFNNSGTFGGTPGLTYDTGDDTTSAVNPLKVNADLLFTEVADHVSADASGFGILWVRASDNALIYTDENGTDVNIAQAAVGTPGGADNYVQFNDGGAFGGDLGLQWDGVTLDINLQSVDGEGLRVFGNNIARTAPLMQLQIDGAGGAAAHCLELLNQASPTGSYALSITGNSGGIVINNAGAGGLPGMGTALDITVSNNFTHGIDIHTDDNSGVVGIYSELTGSASSGAAGRFYTDIASRAASLVQMISDNATGGNGFVLEIQQDGNGNGGSIEMLGKGWIKFPSGNNPSTDLNTLDHYEEGSYAADCRPTGAGSFTISAVTNELYYIKIGRLVHVQGAISISANNAATGDILIDLPFPVGSFADNGEAVRVGVYNLGFSGTNPVADGIGVRVQMFQGDTTAEIKRLGAAVGTVAIAPAWAAFGSLTFNFTYVVED